MVINKNLKHYLYLLEVFTVREIKSRYKASLLGPIWIVIYPVMSAIILNFIFGYILKIKTEGIPYFIFVLSGLLFWNFFQQGIMLAKDSLIWNRELVTKTSFPKDTLILSFIFSKIPDFFVFWTILFIFYIYNGFGFNFLYLAIIFAIIPLSLFSMGISLFIGSANAVFRDFGRIVEFIMMLLFYATPIIYSESYIPEKYKIILYLNPLSTMIMFTRQLLFQNKFRIDLLIYSFTASIIYFSLGFIFFKKIEKKLADLI